jgi:DNA-binding NarL/FixJ family response regulator
MNAIRVLLVDDEAAVLQGLRMRLALEPDIHVVGEAGDGSMAITLATRLQPDVVLMDIRMPVMDGIAATRSLARLVPGAAVVVLSMQDDRATEARALDAGAADFVAKHRMDDGLLTAIRRAVSGQEVIPGLDNAAQSKAMEQPQGGKKDEQRT